MNSVKKCIAILLYLLLTAWIFHFNIASLFNLQQIGLVLLGTLILYLPNLSVQKKNHLDKELIGQSALLGSMLACLVLIFATISDPTDVENMVPTCRPLLYGFCIWIICNEAEAKKQQKEKEKTLTIEDYRSALQEMGLTKRETEVSVLVLQGLTNKEIAQTLFISETTVKKHLSNVFTKLEITAREELRDKIKKS